MLLKKIAVFICVAGLVSAVPKPQGVKGGPSTDEVNDGVDICSLPPVRPSPIACSGFFNKWTFSPAAGTCQEFTYGGCGGTENLFDSETACLSRCGKKVTQQLVDDSVQDPCLLPKAAGNCRAHVPSFYFDSASGSCESFVYTGCKGNGNRFQTQDACIDKCKTHLAKSRADSDAQLAAASALVADTAAQSDPCILPKAAGNCRAHVPSFYFSSASGSCESFVYTGCKGNANRFPNQDACLDKCKAHLAKSQADSEAPVVQAVKNEVTGEGLTREERCSLPPTKSEGAISCLAFIPSWTFNSTSEACEPYVYGGCGKTANLYSSEADCKAACVDAETRALNARQETCLLPVERGPCFAFKPRFAFIKEKNRCEYFTYGGCRGNGNNFKSADECYGTCGGDLPSQLPACEQVTCPASNQRLIDRGCRPEYKGMACCPTSFICPEDTKVETGACWYRGAVYNIGDKIDQISKDNACESRCTCVASPKHNGGATIKCSTLSCDEPFLTPGKTNCSLVTPPGACCSTYRCLEDVPINSTCSFNGKKYLPDENIPTGNPCRRCKCTEGFEGLDGPGCSNVHCLVENRVGCVPVYHPHICCPISYKCLIDAELSKNKTKIIRVDPKPGVQGITTLPMSLSPEGRSLESKQPTPPKPERCQLPKEIGSCKMSQPSYYFDAAKGECSFFYYGGCKGNDNRFDSKEECRNVCQSDDNQEESRIIRIESFPKPTPLKEEKPKMNENCLLPKETGPCRMSLPSFYYDVNTKQCLPFFYGGCRGNANRYVSIERCQKACEPSKNAPSARISEQNTAAQETQKSSQHVEQQVTQSSPARCLLPRQSGPCKMALESYYYDAERKDCFPFYYGGCRGNENRFESIDECRSSCKLEKNQTRPEVCLLEANPGPCKGQVLAYFFNSRTENCESFWYGGCHGNQNRFETEAACQTKCGLEVTAQLEENQQAKRQVSKCNLPADVGPCRSHKQRFYYDMNEKKCKLFGYGGCLGNANNFATERDCLKACASEELSKDLPVSLDGIARTGARALVFNNEIQPEPSIEGSQCRLGNVTFGLGDRILDSSDPCEECVCITPPELTCTRAVCPPFANIPDATCTIRKVLGQCCPVVECVSANPPSIDVCAGVECAADERCEVQEQDSPDGSWKPPAGVCLKNLDSNSDSSQF